MNVFLFSKIGECSMHCKNRIYVLDSWSALEETVRFLDMHKGEHKVDIIHQQIQVMGAAGGNRKVYPPEVLVRAFSYYALSRTLYARIRKDYQLPSVSILARVTSSCNKVSTPSFLKTVFESLEDEKKPCVLLHDEVYIKKSLQYHGGEIFGKAVNDSSLIAETMLGQMINCLHGGKAFLVNMLPVAKLNTCFLYDEISKTMNSIEEASGRLKAIISDANRTNQACFKRFKIVEGKPWLTDQGVYLLYDYVHLMKNIRNLWITKKSSQLRFEDEGKEYIADFQHLRMLFDSEQKSLLKMSNLDEVSVYPKPIERQRVGPCLKVFSEKTQVALTLYGTNSFFRRFSGHNLR